VKVWGLGQGGELPYAGSKYLNPPFPVNALIRPERLKAVGSEVLVQSKLLLSAVGRDTDGAIKLLENLSYMPSTGWWYESPLYFGGVTGDDARRCAFESVWRWYLVTSQADGTLTIPNIDENITDIRQLLPLRDTLLDQDDYLDGEYYQPGRAYLEGTFWNRGLDDDNTNDGTRYLGQWKLHKDIGLVELAEPAFKFSTSGREAADLYLTTSYSVQPSYASAPLRYSRSRQLSGAPGIAGAGDRLLERPDMKRTIVVDYQNVTELLSVVDNVTTLDSYADTYLTQIEREYNQTPSADMEYAGLYPLAVSGLISQVRWSCGRGRPMITRASRYKEFNVFAPSRLARRRAERLDLLLEGRP